MPRKFDDTVRRVADRITGGGIILTERIRKGRRRNISIGPYRSATSTKRQYALCTIPALPGEGDCQVYPSANRTARAFVRFVGVDNAQDALVRETRKRNG